MNITGRDNLIPLCTTPPHPDPSHSDLSCLIVSHPITSHPMSLPHPILLHSVPFQPMHYVPSYPTPLCPIPCFSIMFHPKPLPHPVPCQLPPPSHSPTGWTPPSSCPQPHRPTGGDAIKQRQHTDGLPLFSRDRRVHLRRILQTMGHGNMRLGQQGHRMGESVG